jgi:hypothetical protein
MIYIFLLPNLKSDYAPLCVPGLIPFFFLSFALFVLNIIISDMVRYFMSHVNFEY